MALKKIIITGVGVPCEYHKVGVIYRDNIQKMAIINICSYYNETVKEETNQEVVQSNERAEGDDYQAYFGIDIVNQNGINDLSQAYKFLKEKCPRYEGSEDC